jgi:hypothetical protein
MAWTTLDPCGAVLAALLLCAPVSVQAHGDAKGPSVMPATSEATGPAMTIYRSASCGCCTQWGEHIAAAGFLINDHVREDMDRVKQAYGIAPDQASCHTAIVQGYVIEGHVPASSIQRLLAERPDIRGLAVPEMPIGSPGMEVKGRTADPFAVMAIGHDGSTTVFERY